MNIHIKSILAALAFSLLFYSKNFGLNVFLISLIIGSLLAANQKEKPVPWIYLIAFCFSGLMVFVSPSILNLFACLASFLVLIGKTIANKSSTYIAGLLGVISISMASFGNLIGSQNKNQESVKHNPKTFLYVKGISIALIFVAVFTVLYRTSNPIFDGLLTKIDFSFISINWLLCTVLGYFIFLHLLRPFYSEDLIQQDIDLPNDLPKPNLPFSIFKLKKMGNEVTMGSIIFAALNLLLVFFLITDVIYLTSSNNNINYSESVHHGVYALIFSIACAIAIILYFFKGSLNFYEKNNSLLYLAYTWIALNVLLTITTFYKNFIYVSELGLTYKRIGVFVYLFLILAGLITTAIKVKQQKNFWYLSRSNTTIAFTMLIISTSIPWDMAITKYNLTNIENPDISYLLELSTENSKMLYDYKLQHPDASKNNYDTFISNRYSHYLQEQNSKSWQEYSIKNITLN